MLNSVLSSAAETGISLSELLMCTAASLAFGLIVALVFMFRSTYSKSFVVTLTLMPAIVQLVIMMVNGNLGAGVAVMGAFSLVRFRSTPGSAREIGAIFLAMALGLATGMGYITVAAIFLLIVAAATLILSATPFGEQKVAERLLKVTIPEDLDYTGIFDDLFQTYTTKSSLRQVKTTNMGSLYELQYEISLKDPDTERALLDAIRVRNGNLTIVCGRIPSREEL